MKIRKINKPTRKTTKKAAAEERRWMAEETRKYTNGLDTKWFTKR